MSATRVAMLPCPACRGNPTRPGCSICFGQGAIAAPPRFVAVKRSVIYGGVSVATCRSHTFAKRIAKALNEHVVNREGV